jgi:hypothetical protein
LHRAPGLSALHFARFLDDALIDNPHLDWVWADDMPGRGYRIHQAPDVTRVYVDGHLELHVAASQLLTAITAARYGGNGNVLPFAR